MPNYIKYENYIIPFSAIICLYKSEHKKYSADYTKILEQYPILKIYLNDNSSVDIKDLKCIEEIQNNYITWLESQSKQQLQF